MEFMKKFYSVFFLFLLCSPLLGAQTGPTEEEEEEEEGAEVCLISYESKSSEH